MFLPNPGILAAGAGIVPPGQQLFTTNGTLIVPPNVTSICAVAIGQGGAGIIANGYRGGGGGGELRYINARSVTPGSALTIIIDNESSRVLLATTVLLKANNGKTYYYGGAGGRNGVGDGGMDGAGGQANDIYNGQYSAGGAAGGYLSHPNAGSSPYGHSAQNGPTSVWGGGGHATSSSYSGQPGCVRFMWGEGRAFPNTNTGDM